MLGALTALCILFSLQTSDIKWKKEKAMFYPPRPSFPRVHHVSTKHNQRSSTGWMLHWQRVFINHLEKERNFRYCFGKSQKKRKRERRERGSLASHVYIPLYTSDVLRGFLCIFARTNTFSRSVANAVNAARSGGLINRNHECWRR